MRSRRGAKPVRGSPLVSSLEGQVDAIDDVVDGFLAAARAGRGEGEVYNLGSGDEISVSDLVSKVESLLGRKIDVGEPLPYRPNEIWRFVGDHTRSREVLKWNPVTSLDEGLSRTIEWYENLPRK